MPAQTDKGALRRTRTVDLTASAQLTDDVHVFDRDAHGPACTCERCVSAYTAAWFAKATSETVRRSK